MASEVDICNLALGHLGDDAGITSISPPDGSMQASHCKRYYPIARDALLEMHNWNFATQRITLAQVSIAALPAEWAFAYGYPSCVKVRSVHLPDEVSTAPTGAIFDPSEFVSDAVNAQPFVIETLVSGDLVIYANVEDAAVRITRRVTDTTKFTPLFVAALARLLAAYLAGPVIKGEKGMTVAAKQLEWFEKIEGMRAKVSDSQSGRNTSYNKFTPSSIAARR